MNMSVFSAQDESVSVISTRWICQCYKHKMNLSVFSAQDEPVSVLSTRWICQCSQHKMNLSAGISTVNP